jgi:exopolyphosphatase/pppGpp-phosphohydrolase
MYGSMKIAKTKKKTKPTQEQMFEQKKPPMAAGKSISGLTLKQSEKIREHSKLHKGGMNSKHIKNMIKFMKAGDSFTQSHNKAVKEDKKK